MTDHPKSSPHDLSMQVYVALLILAQLRHGAKTGTREIQQVLEQHGIKRHLRSIQRVLNKLSKRLPIECDNSSPAGWRWSHAANPAFVDALRSAAR